MQRIRCHDLVSKISDARSFGAHNAALPFDLLPRGELNSARFAGT